MVKLSSGFIKYASASIPAMLPERDKRREVIILNFNKRKAKAPINENNIPKIVPSRVFDIVFGSLLLPNTLPKLQKESPNATIIIALAIISFGITDFASNFTYLNLPVSRLKGDIGKANTSL